MFTKVRGLTAYLSGFCKPGTLRVQLLLRGLRRDYPEESVKEIGVWKALIGRRKSDWRCSEIRWSGVDKKELSFPKRSRKV